MDNIEQQARELLAAEYERDGQTAISGWVRAGLRDQTPCFRAIVLALTMADNYKRAMHSKQAKIDALMLEYCPAEMTKAQRDEWAAHQVAPTPTGENAKHVEALGWLRIGVEMDSAHDPQGEEKLAAIDAARRALSAALAAEQQGGA